MKFKTYLVGGAVRDGFLGVASKDHDYVVLAPSFEAMKQSLLDDGCKIFVEKPEYHTIRAKHPVLGAVDFACARKDGSYTDGRRPDITSITTDLTEDLARRDFTCNAIAKDVETNEIVDPFEGCMAISSRMLTAVGSARARFDEDKLRAFRALRFAITKSFKLDAEICNAIWNLTPKQFDGVSTERIREELYKMFKYDWIQSFDLLNKFVALRTVVQQRGIWLRPTTEE